METLMQDIKFSLRRLLKSPGFTAIAVVALALGIGANTAIFSVINAVLLRSLPYKDPDGIVRVWDNFLQRGLTEIAVSIPEYHDYKKESQSFEHMAAIFSATFTITDPGEPERVEAASVSYNFFPLLGVDPVLGRTFAPEEDQAGNDNVVLLSHELWQRRFGANQGVLGEKITIDGLVVTVIGVMPPGFDYPDNAAMWVPVGFTPQMLAPSRRGARNLSVLARVKPGVTLQQAQADMDRVASNLQSQHPDFYPENAGYKITLVPLLESTVGKIRPMLLLVLGVVGFVLLIACINVANLLLARSYALQKTVAIRAALGANRARLIREFLTESVLLALAGGAAGLLLAYWGIYVLVAVSPKDSIPRIEEITLDASVLVFTFGVSLLTGIIFGIVPALQASKHDLNEVLKEGGRGSSGGGVKHLLPNSLVIAEVAVTIVLLTAAGLMIKSFYVLRNAEPGFTPGNAMTMRTYVPLNSKYRDPAQQAAFFEQSLEKIRQIPGVESAGASFYLPLAGASLSCSFLPESSEFTPGGNTPEADWRAVSPGFFESLNIPLLKGRDFNQFDRPGTPVAVVIDQTLAERYWPNEDPLGKRLKLTLPMVKDQWLTVVGVVGYVWNSKMNSMARPEVYTSFIQTPMPAMSFVVRGAMDSNQLTAAVTREIHQVESLVPVYEVKSMQKIVSDSLGDSRLLMLLLSVFAGVALVLASVGIYGVMSYSVTQRTHEIGIRMAMGARAVDVLQLVFRKGLALTLIGAALGLAASYAFAYVLNAFVAGLLYGTSATDLLVFLLTPLVLILVAVFACFVPARRATRVDPVIALRFE